MVATGIAVRRAPTRRLGARAVRALGVLSFVSAPPIAGQRSLVAGPCTTAGEGPPDAGSTSALKETRTRACVNNRDQALADRRHGRRAHRRIVW